MLKYITAMPRSFVISLLNLYRKIISPIYGNVCNYFPSCSAYAIEAIMVHGLIVGTFLSLKRILSCNPWGEHGVFHVQNRKDGKVTAGPTYAIWNPKPSILVLNHPKIIIEE